MSDPCVDIMQERASRRRHGRSGEARRRSAGPEPMSATWTQSLSVLDDEAELGWRYIGRITAAVPGPDAANAMPDTRSAPGDLGCATGGVPLAGSFDGHPRGLPTLDIRLAVIVEPDMVPVTWAMSPTLNCPLVAGFFVSPNAVVSVMMTV